MNTPEHSQEPSDPKTHLARGRHRRRAVALILVIAFIVLLTGLVVAFFSRVTTELSSAKSYAEGVTVRQLADSAVGVVMGQIREATSLKNVCWASQPGMIRTYGTGTQASSAPYAFYKLYSSHDLILSKGKDIEQFDPSVTSVTGTSEVPIGTGGWSQQAAFFTDLNQPVDVPDPTAGPNTKKTIKRYPIFDASVAAIYDSPTNRPAKPNWLVEGAEVVLPQSARATNDAPMPVRWIYVLRDGTLTAPPPLTGAATGTIGLVATWKAVSSDNNKTGVPTKDNPIVGRIAFWADDDSCKVNINTAGGFMWPDGVDEDVNLNYTASNWGGTEKNPGYYAGAFWDTPRVQTHFDKGINDANTNNYRPGLANAQPAQNEFQRYPGHPATTSLGLIFRYLLPPGNKSNFDSEHLYAMTPRLTPGGSLNGTKYLDVTNPKQSDPLKIKLSYDGLASAGTSSPTNQGYHLWASVDEMFYSTMNGPRTAVENGINQWPYLNSEVQMAVGTITPKMLDQVRFFVTANNRSPDLNLFGRPRVTIWPVPNAVNEQDLQGLHITNVSDDLIRFCATIGRHPDAQQQAITRQGEFIFERKDPYSSTVDFNLPRNQAIFTYLRDVTSPTTGLIPGWGKSLGQKYANGPGGFDQILTEIFDYIRTINQKDNSRDRQIDAARTPQSPENNRLKTAARYAPHALVLPTRATVNGKPVSGFGRYPTVSEASLVLYHAGYTCVPKAKSELEKGDLPDGGSARKPGNNSEVVIYDVSKTPSDLDLATGIVNANGMANKHPELPAAPEWVKKNVEKWTGQLIRAFIVFETFNPMQGYAPYDNFANVSLADTTKKGVDGKFFRYPYADPVKGTFVHQLQLKGAFTIESTGSNGPKPLGIGEGTTFTNKFTRTSGDTYAGRNFGGTEGFFHTMQDSISSEPSARTYYPFQSRPSDPNDPFHGIRVGLDDTSVTVNAGEAELKIGYEDQLHQPPKELELQTVSLDFKGGTWPMPKPWFRPDAGGFDTRAPGFNSNTNPAYPTSPTTPWATWAKTARNLPAGWAMGYNLPSRIAWTAQVTTPKYGPTNTTTGEITGDGHNYTNRFLQILQPGDTIRSLIAGGGDPTASDIRIASLQSKVDTLQTHPNYFSTTKRWAQTLRRGDGGFYFDPTIATYTDGGNITDPPSGSFFTWNGYKYHSGYGPDFPPTESDGTTHYVAKRSDKEAADFDTGIGLMPDGPFAGKADEGNVAAYWYDPVTGLRHYREAYFTWTYDSPLDTYFSPNRQVPGPAMFGSLPAPDGPWAKASWKTLLFCPNPAGAKHPGSDQQGQVAPDHLLLDLFTMPVVEPYAISEPFSTAGKVNLNYPMVPFSYIKRTTALRAALHSVRVTAIPQTFSYGANWLDYKGRYDSSNNLVDNPHNLRYLVDRDETLKGFDAFFDLYKDDRSKGFFKSASQICERFFYPKGQVYGGGNIKYSTGENKIRGFWADSQLTGDNVREKPYADLYPRITTKSNTYTVHFRVQTLRQRPYTGNPNGAAAYYRSFDQTRDSILSEYRGSTAIERYLDPEDARFQPRAKDHIDVETESLEQAYRFRVISNKRFSPW